MTIKTLLLIDGDQFIFKATAALEKETRWDDQNHVLYSNAEECWATLTGMIKRIFERFEHSQHALCFSAANNFRKVIDPTYKSGRSPRKPLCYAALRERVEGEYNCIAMEGLEADDVMGILATKPNALHKIIVSQDKDMKTIPATVWNGVDLINVTTEQADYWHMYQTLIGDSSDGYKGCPGVGPKKAEKLLTDAEAPGDDGENEYMERDGKHWPRVVHAYKKAKLTEQDALIQARLARILRWTDWDTETKKPILWSPK